MSIPPVDPFKKHLVVLLSFYENGPVPNAQIPRYEGPGDWQIETILRSLQHMAQRMWIAEKPPSPDKFGPLVVPPGPLIFSPVGSDMSSVEELGLLKAQVSDIARECSAGARGDLAQRIATESLYVGRSRHSSKMW
ncbi:hypothetical protein HYPSUDRAFT_944823 [Hypholoma sublateritium FD-334 SS-4]|uniref:Uncharacterized protein n=1 Tax=Hypholoma sublateritium (strain FD-334 SS-4) TaxID=945553 RepID=A0A0D2LIR8_HYPSF|nr:hypothetical protein HYPSUDRAFT_944823 [Hypholoma sublateritium FD-334 SS-4]